MLFDGPRVIRKALELRPTVLHLHDPELLPLAVAARFRQQNLRVVYDAHEDLGAQILVKPWIPAPLRRPLSWMADIVLHWLGSQVDAVVVANDLTAPKFRHATPVRNYPIAALWAGEAVSVAPPNPVPVRFVYAGGLTEQRGATTMANAFRGVRVAYPDAALDLAGKWSDPGLERRTLSTSEGIRYHGWLTPDRLPLLYRGATAGLLLLAANRNHRECTPTKLFEYMAAGIPVIASDFPEWRAALRGIDCALFVDPHDEHAVTSAMLRLSSDSGLRQRLGAAGLGAAGRFMWDTEAKTLLSLYRRLITAGSERGAIA
jgi:glycosyltransferase involved in cell wall biosynthesis